MNSSIVRQNFLDFFRNKGHEVVPSAAMVVKNDPTLMFTNAGMNQFKDIFLDNAPVKFKRIANTQKCLRVSGKHNDLEEVGHDGYHHTMFEMLGNWSFGDYFKQEAIQWAWEFLTDVMKIDKERIYVTIFEGDQSEGLDRDLEAYNYWNKLIDENRILPGNKKDNFWEMGDSGPCGPCSEIHVDIRPDVERKALDGKMLVNKGNPRVIEIWNLVFIQYNRRVSGELELLKNKHVDTGMGFERLCMVLQNKSSNYDTDIFQPIIQEIASLTRIDYGKSENTDVAMRVVADHLRAVAFAIADGQLPSNAKAGYVIRRILRRAVRYNYTFLEQNKPVIYKLMPALLSTMGEAFPELKSQWQLIEKVIYEEEQAFLHTLETGDKRLKESINTLKNEKKNALSGKIAFELYDTYGFPLDLTELILKENNLAVNRQEFDQAMTEQRNRSKSAAAVESADWVMVRPDGSQGEFVGYDRLHAEVRICRFRKLKTKDKQFFHLVLDQTPFYAESGGQVGDTGYLDDGEEKIRITNTFKEHGLIIHVAEKLPQDVSQVFEAVVSGKARRETANNHTATHLLHHALREVLGKHVEQKGSLVNADYLRFDFLHYQKMTEDEITAVEILVNQKIREGIERKELRETSMEEAREMGAMALFGEKYRDRVRVIQFGDSVELCGGTHVDSTSQIGLFKILSESSIAAGVRRIEAITGGKAEAWYRNLEKKMNSVEQLLNSPQDVKKAVETLIEEKSSLQKQVERYAREATHALKEDLLKKVHKAGDYNLISAVLENTIGDPGIIRDVAYQLRGEVGDLFLVIGAVVGDKPHLAVMIHDNLIRDKKLHAGEIIKTAAREMEGGGGGQAFFATAGGKNAAKLEKAVGKAVEMFRKAVEEE
ncbi:MAG: alanine--tRNA ligase [Bacteroidales bacterium]|nr:alanine--tRNA ligase [Bacteroidales bacterium]